MLNTWYLQAKEGTRRAVRSRASKIDARLHSMAAETWPWPRFRVHAAAARAAPDVGLVPAIWVMYNLSDLYFLLPKITYWASKTWASCRL